MELGKPVEKLSWRERKVLRAFEARDLIYTYQLPRDVGHKTMAGLVKKGLVAVSDESRGRYSMEYGWRLAAGYHDLALRTK